MDITNVILACLAFIVGFLALWQQHMWRREGSAIDELKDKMRFAEKRLQRLTRASNHYYVAIRDHVIGWIAFSEKIAKQLDNDEKYHFFEQLKAYRESAVLRLRKMELGGACCELQNEALMYFIGTGKSVNKEIVELVRFLYQNNDIDEKNRTLALRILN